MFMKNWVQHDQGGRGAIGLAFKFFDLIFYVIWVFWVVVEFGIVEPTCERRTLHYKKSVDP